MTQTLQFRTLAWVFAAGLTVSACTSGSESNPGTSEVTPESTTSTTDASPAPTTSTTAEPGLASDVRTEFGLLVVYEHSISVRPAQGETYTVEGDFEVPLIAAYDDLNGGIVFQYRRTPALLGEHIWHLASGSGQPEPLVSAEPGRQLRLMDFGLYNERSQVLYLDRPANGGSGELYVAGLSGGAPELVSDLPGISSASMSPEAVAISTRVGACNSAVILDTTGETTTTYDCSRSVADVRLDGASTQVAFLSGGQVQPEHLTDGPIATNWPENIRTTNQVFDFADDVVIVRDGATGFRMLDTNGATFSFRASKPVQWVSILRNDVTVGSGASLGGMREPTGSCSALGLPSPPIAQAELPESVVSTRGAIVEAATTCDFDGLEQLAGPQFQYSFGDASADLSRWWQQSDQQNFDTLAVIVRTLDLPFGVSLAPNGVTSYVWPAVAAIENPTDADWQAIAPVYNEEEIEFYKNFGGFVGLRIFISEDGIWTTAIAGE